MFFRCQGICLFADGMTGNGVCVCCLGPTLPGTSINFRKVQRRAARWVLSDYSYYSSVTAMLQQLNWLPLAKRRKQQRLKLLYQIMHGIVGLSLPDYIHFTIRHTRQLPFRLIVPSTNTTSYVTSFFPIFGNGIHCHHS